MCHMRSSVMCTFQNLQVIAGKIHHLTVRTDKIFAVLNYVVQYILWLMLIFFVFCCRGECSCTPVRFFVIVSMQRSGSGWFETLMNSHPNISSNGEIFNRVDRRENISSILQTLDRLYNLDWLTSAAKNECTAAFGLKWMLNQVL